MVSSKIAIKNGAVRCPFDGEYYSPEICLECKKYHGRMGDAIYCLWNFGGN